VIDGVLALAGDLVDLVDVDDAGLGLLDVVVSGLDQLEQDVLDVLADVAASVSAVASAMANGTLSIWPASGPAASCRSGRARAAGCGTASQLDGARRSAGLHALVVVVDRDRQVRLLSQQQQQRKEKEEEKRHKGGIRG
jgi:hypothetical protein